MTDRTSVDAELAAVEGDSARLDVFCNHGNLAIMVRVARAARGVDLSGLEAPVQVRYDRHPLSTDTWMVARDGGALYAPDPADHESTSLTASPLWRADSLWVVAPAADGGSLRSHFPVRGAAAARDSVRAACRPGA